MKLHRVLGLCALVPILMGMGPSRCTMPTEIMSPLPASGELDERLVGFWYLLSDGEVLETLQIVSNEEEQQLGLIYSPNYDIASTPVLAVATPSSVDGIPFYSIRRIQEAESGMPVFDWTGPEEEPGSIVAAPLIEDDDTLHIFFMNPNVVRELAEQGRIDAQLVEVFRYKSSGERVAPAERDEERPGIDFGYYLVDASQEQLVDLIRNVPKDELFSLHAGPYHRADPSGVDGEPPWHDLPNSVPEGLAQGIGGAVAEVLGPDAMVDEAQTSQIELFDPYEDENLADSEVAIFETTDNVSIGLVHDQANVRVYSSTFDGPTQQIRLRPGTYRITFLVTYNRCGGCQRMLERAYEVEAEHTYLLDKLEAQYFWWSLEERDETGKSLGIIMF